MRGQLSHDFYLMVGCLEWKRISVWWGMIIIWRCVYSSSRNSLYKRSSHLAIFCSKFRPILSFVESVRPFGFGSSWDHGGLYIRHRSPNLMVGHGLHGPGSQLHRAAYNPSISRSV
jgi:hypothetical protein